MPPRLAVKAERPELEQFTHCLNGVAFQPGGIGLREREAGGDSADDLAQLRPAVERRGDVEHARFHFEGRVRSFGELEPRGEDRGAGALWLELLLHEVR